VTDLERCDREIAEILAEAAAGDKPAWLIAVGVNDWQIERRLIEIEQLEALNRATPEQIAQAMERLPTDVLEWAVRFESLAFGEPAPRCI
jgi:hypothetical protein